MAGGTVNWEPPAFSPDTGLFYVSERNPYLDLLPHRSATRADRWGWAARKRFTSASAGSFLTAIDYRNGKIAWRHRYPTGNGGGGGILATAGKLVFAGDAGGNIVAHDALTGKPLWHSRIGNVTNAPITYRLDGRQYVLVATGDTLFSFVLLLIGLRRVLFWITVLAIVRAPKKGSKRPSPLDSSVGRPSFESGRGREVHAWQTLSGAVTELPA